VIEKGIVSILLGNTPLASADRLAAQSALVTALGGPRIFPQAAPEGTGYPYGIVRRTGGDHPHHMLGRAGLGQIRIGIDFYCASSYQDARYLVQQAFTLLDGYRGQAGAPASPPAGYFIQGMFAADSPDEYIPPAHSENPGVQACGQEFTVWANEN
jgi:hypothetical protein